VEGGDIIVKDNALSAGKHHEIAKCGRGERSASDGELSAAPSLGNSIVDVDPAAEARSGAADVAVEGDQ
jgi:hypothetical protein